MSSYWCFRLYYFIDHSSFLPLLISKVSLPPSVICLLNFSLLAFTYCAFRIVNPYFCGKKTLSSGVQCLPKAPFVFSLTDALLLFSLQVMSDSLQPHRLQHTGIPCPSLSPRACLNSCPLSQWCHPPISSSIVPFSSCPQSFPVSPIWVALTSLKD